MHPSGLNTYCKHQSALHNDSTQRTNAEMQHSGSQIAVISESAISRSFSRCASKNKLKRNVQEQFQLLFRQIKRLYRFLLLYSEVSINTWCSQILAVVFGNSYTSYMHSWSVVVTPKNTLQPRFMPQMRCSHL